MIVTGQDRLTRCGLIVVSLTALGLPCRPQLGSPVSVAPIFIDYPDVKIRLQLFFLVV